MQTIDALMARVERLETENAALRKENAELRQENAALRMENKKLRHQNQELIRRVYGSSSEKFSADQLSLELDCPDQNRTRESENALSEDDEEPQRQGRASKDKQRRLKKSMESLPTTSEVLEPQEVIDSPQDWKCIGEEVCEELHYQPARYWRHQIIRPRYARREESIEEVNIALAVLPPRLLDKSVLTPSLLASIITNKYCWHLPLYRQEQLMRSAGVSCSRALLSSWMSFAANKLKPLYTRLKKKLFQSDYLQIDETTISYLKPGSGLCQTGYLWTLLNPQVGAYYEWHPGRGHSHCS